MKTIILCALALALAALSGCSEDWETCGKFCKGTYSYTHNYNSMGAYRHVDCACGEQK